MAGNRMIMINVKISEYIWDLFKKWNPQNLMMAHVWMSKKWRRWYITTNNNPHHLPALPELGLKSLTAQFWFKVFANEKFWKAEKQSQFGRRKRIKIHISPLVISGISQGFGRHNLRSSSGVPLKIPPHAAIGNCYYCHKFPCISASYWFF